MEDKIVVEICDNCAHQTFNKNEGLVCGLTKEKPDYLISCELFEGVPSKVKDHLWKEEKKQEDLLKSKVRRALIVVALLALALAIYFMLRKFNHDLGEGAGGAVHSIFN